MQPRLRAASNLTATGDTLSKGNQARHVEADCLGRIDDRREENRHQGTGDRGRRATAMTLAATLHSLAHASSRMRTTEQPAAPTRGPAPAAGA